MNSGWIEFGIILILVLFNGVFALAEMAIVAATQARLKQNVEAGKPGAESALELANNSGFFLSTVQLGITLVGVAAGAFGGSSLADNISPLITRIPALEPYAEAISLTLVVLLITYLSLVLGELVPKTLAMSNPEKYARHLAPLMKTISRMGRPLVNFLDGSTKGVIRLLGIKIPKRKPVTDEDLRMLIDQGALSGVLNRQEEVMMEQVLNMDESRIESLITPRSQIIWLDFNASQEEIRRTLVNHKRSKYPVALGQLDQLRGVVYAQELLEQHLTTGKFDIPAILHQPVVIPESLNILETIDRLTVTQSGIAFVLNEFGGIDGLIADDDLTEALIGFKADSHPTTDPAIVKREDGSWLVDGLLPLTRFRELVGKKPLTDDERLYQTLGGLIMTELGKIPISGESLTWENVHLEVVDMDGNRVDKVIARLT
jgi:putative hemolysin